jgi:hypothetical protein
MQLDDLLEQLAQFPREVYGYALLAALAGPFVLRIAGLGSLARLARPLALIFVLGGMYAKQQRAGERKPT